MLQVTGHAGGVPKATLERGRSVLFPFSGNYGYMVTSLFASVLTVVSIVCALLDPLSITIVDYLLIKLWLDLRPKV